MVFVAEITFVGNFFIGGKSAELHPFSTVSQDSAHKPISPLQALWPIEISRFWEGQGVRFLHATQLDARGLGSHPTCEGAGVKLPRPTRLFNSQQ